MVLTFVIILVGTIGMPFVVDAVGVQPYSLGKMEIENLRVENLQPPETIVEGAENLKIVWSPESTPVLENLRMVLGENALIRRSGYVPLWGDNTIVWILENKAVIPIVPERVQILEVFEELNLSVMENGSADLKYSLRLPESVLAELYAETFGIERPNLTVTLGAENLEAFQEATGVLLGKETKITSAKVTMNVENEFRLSAQAEPLRLAEFDPDIGIWKTSIGAPETDAMGLRVAQMMFMQLMLDSLPGKQRLESSSITSVELPEGATILNTDELSELAWRVDFGGGTYREAFVEVRENTAVLVERTVVTERPITLSPDEFLENLFGFGTLTIEYEVGTSGTESESRPPEPSTKTWSKKWCATRSYPISENFSWSGTYQGAYATADLNLNADPSLNVEVYIGWGYLGSKLQWFRTYWQMALHGSAGADAEVVIVVSENVENGSRTVFPGGSELPVLAEEETSINPPVSIHFSGNIRGGIESSWSREYNIYTHRFGFFIGWWPVWVDLDLDLIPGVDMGANASLQFDAGISVWASGKFGVEWTREDGWRGIKELDYDFGYTDPSIQGEADISIEPYVKFKAGLYIYSLVGPYAYLKPLAQLEASYPERTWILGAGFDINAGVGFGKLGRWLGLSDWEPDPPLYSRRMLLGSGNW